MNDSSVRELARRAGIAVQWTDHTDKRHRVPLDAIRRILVALELPCDTPDEITYSHRALDNATIPPLVTATAGRLVDLPWRMADSPPRARLVHEDGSEDELPVRETAGGIRLPGIKAIGYHTLEVGQRSITLAVAPARCITIEDIAGECVAGLAAQIYALRHAGDCGIGDMSGVTALARSAAALGLDALALSPAHALFAADPEHFSPYSPSNRLFYNPLHADVTSMLGEDRVARARIAAGVAFSARELESSSLIDWRVSAQVKMAVLRCLFEDFAATDLAANSKVGLASDFANFCAARGSALQQHAAFEALHQARLKTNPETSNWQDWPATWRDPRSATVGEFIAKNRREISFHCFLQWLAERSFAGSQKEARRAGMRIGLIADLAVGMNSSSSYAWAHQDQMLGGLRIGAPPDAFNANGQNWGSNSVFTAGAAQGGLCTVHCDTSGMHAPRWWLAHRSRNGIYAALDHSRGCSTERGCVHCLSGQRSVSTNSSKSYRHRAVVIGEDLGTVRAGFRERLARTGICGMSVLWFARDDKGFIPPHHWPRAAAAMTSTHDLPTVSGWWRGTDLEARASCGLIKNARAERLARDAERETLWIAFKSAQAAQGDPPAAGEASRVVDAAVRFIAKTPSQIALLPLEDAIGLERQPNMPGTVDQYPNWRHRYAAEAATLLDDSDVRHRIETLANRGAQ